MCAVWFVTGVLVGPRATCAQTSIKLADDRKVPAKGDAEFRFELAEIPAGKQVRLCLEARIEWGGLGGSTSAMVVQVNEVGLVGRHLANKPLLFTMRNDMELAWAAEGGSGYRLMYSPDFSDRIKTDEGYEYGIPDTDPYRFVWDITSYVRAGGNLVTVSALRGMAFSLRLRDVAVEIGDPLPPLTPAAPSDTPTEEPDQTGPLPVYVPRDPAELPASIDVSSCGDIRFSIGHREFNVRSRTSLPEGRWSDGGRPGATRRQLRRGRSATSKWREANYSVRRRVTLHADHIAVADTIRNTGEGLLGVIHEVRLALPSEPRRSFLGGHPVTRLKQSNSPSHPTAMAEFGDLAIGLVAEDDIFRVHFRGFVEDRTLAISDPQLGIPAGKAHTLEWSVYAVPHGDYWDLVNAIRRNWGANDALRGPSKWAHPGGIPTEAGPLKGWLEDASILVLCNPMFGTEQERAQGITIQHGTALSHCTAWCERAADGVRAPQQADPEAEALIYTHQNLCTEPGHEGKYRDSRAVDTGGTAATTVYWPSPSVFLPTLSNAYGEALMEIHRLIAEGMDANVYVDEITASNVPAFGDYGDIWDGCTVVIDPVSHAITGKRSSAILLMQPWREALMAYLRSRGKTVIANGAPWTRTMMGWGIQWFVESGPGDNIVVGAHLSHPLCLTHYGGPISPERVGVARQLLDRAGILFVPFAVDAPVFPITPIELRAGVVIGEERILTNRSGRFGWGDGSTADVHVFDEAGQRAANPDVRELRRGETVLTELRLPAGHLAILVRKRG